jgi:hypothetical protein
MEHGGNVHEKGIVTITSKSIDDDNPSFHPANTADLSSQEWFRSKSEPGQWICWNFRPMRVRLTHYTIEAKDLKSWVLEGSLDGMNWTESDRQTNNRGFNGLPYPYTTSTFRVSCLAEFRLIRLTQSGKRHDRTEFLCLHAVEFFGTLSK